MFPFIFLILLLVVVFAPQQVLGPTKPEKTNWMKFYESLQVSRAPHYFVLYIDEGEYESSLLQKQGGKGDPTTHNDMSQGGGEEEKLKKWVRHGENEGGLKLVEVEQSEVLGLYYVNHKDPNSPKIRVATSEFDETKASHFFKFKLSEESALDFFESEFFLLLRRFKKEANFHFGRADDQPLRRLAMASNYELNIVAGENDPLYYPAVALGRVMQLGDKQGSGRSEFGWQSPLALGAHAQYTVRVEAGELEIFGGNPHWEAFLRSLPLLNHSSIRLTLLGKLLVEKVAEKAAAKEEGEAVGKGKQKGRDEGGEGVIKKEKVKRMMEELRSTDFVGLYTGVESKFGDVKPHQRIAVSSEGGREFRIPVSNAEEAERLYHSDFFLLIPVDPEKRSNNDDSNFEPTITDGNARDYSIVPLGNLLQHSWLAEFVGPATESGGEGHYLVVRNCDSTNFVRHVDFGAFQVNEIPAGKKKGRFECWWGAKR